MKKIVQKTAAAAAFFSAVLLPAGEIRQIGQNPFPDMEPPLNPEWTLFENPDMRLFRKEMLLKIPAKIGTVQPEKVRFREHIYRFERKKCLLTDHALFFNEFETDRDAMLVMGFGADWFMKVWLDGVVLADTLKTGNRKPDISTGNFAVRVPVRKGKHLLTAEVRSGKRSYVFAAGPLPCGNQEAEQFFRRVAETDWRVMDAKRQKCMDLIEKSVLRDISSTVFEDFDRIPAGDPEKYYEPFPILAIYDGALEKLIREIPGTAVGEGTAVIWHLYNMGYVIKTSRYCFGIDLHHRRAHLLAPYLDFILTTHNHSDHYNMALIRAMAAAGKKVYTSFYPAPGYMRDPGTIRLDGLEIITGKADHNKDLPGFVTTWLIRIGQGKKTCVIYHTGDACSHEQLDPVQHVNIWIPHPRVGLDVVEGAKKIKPDRIFFSHFLEMGHCHPCIWRPVSFKEVQERDIPQCTKLGVRSTIPLWGEKIIWTANGKQN